MESASYTNRMDLGGPVVRRWLLLVLFFVLGLLYFFTIRDGHDWGGDFSIYVLQARNFAEHRRFDQNSYVATEESLLHHPAVYPPLTSLLLAPAYVALGLNYIAFKAVLDAFLWLSLPLYYVLGRRRGLPPLVSAAIVVIFGLSSLVLAVRNSVVSDSVFLFFSAAALLLIHCVYERGWDHSYPVKAGVGIAALLLLSYMSRVAGLALMVAFVGHEIWRTRRPRLFSVVSVGLLCVSLIVYTRLAFQAGQQYGSQFSFLPGMYLENALYYLRSPAALWSAAPRALRYALTLAFLGFAPVAFLRRLRRPSAVEFYVIVSLAVLIVYTTNPRYMLPIIPFLLMYAAEGVLSVSVRLLPTRRSLIPAACGTAALMAAAFNLHAVQTGPIMEGVLEPTFLQACSFLQRETPANALVLSWNPRVFALYTGRRSALYSQAGDPTAVLHDIPNPQPAFLVYYDHDLDRQKMLPYLERTGKLPEPVFQNRSFRIYRLAPDSE